MSNDGTTPTGGTPDGDPSAPQQPQQPSGAYDGWGATSAGQGEQPGQQGQPWGGQQDPQATQQYGAQPYGGQPQVLVQYVLSVLGAGGLVLLGAAAATPVARRMVAQEA